MSTISTYRVSTYQSRKSGIDEVNEDVFDLSELEKVLVMSQDVMEIRGKACPMF